MVNSDLLRFLIFNLNEAHYVVRHITKDVKHATLKKNHLKESFF